MYIWGSVIAVLVLGIFLYIYNTIYEYKKEYQVSWCDSFQTMYSKIRMGFNKLLLHIPVLSVIPHCKWRHFKSASKELFVVLLVSTMPIWLGAWVMRIAGAKETNFLILMLSNIKHGELYIYATSTIAPVMYMMTVDPHEGKHPSRLAYYVTFFLVMILSATSFAIQRMSIEWQPAADIKFIDTTSWLLFIGSILLLFLSISYKNSFETDGISPEEFKEPVREFSAGYSSHRKQHNE